MNIIPFPYAIPDEYIVEKVPEKMRLFSEVIPGNSSSYRYGPGEEQAYHQQYRESRFAYTSQKGGWDCLRHYEILANGCIPVFHDLDTCPKETMITFPKQLVLEACAALLPWFDDKEHCELYNQYVEKLLAHCRHECSISALCTYFLRHIPISVESPKILMLSCHIGVNYTREFLSIGLRRSLGANFTEYPRLDFLYSGTDVRHCHGSGFTYSGKFTEDPCDRSEICDRILRHEFDLILYGKTGHDEGPLGSYPNLPFIQEVMKIYTSREIVFLYGGDGCQQLTQEWNPYTQHLLNHRLIGTCFVRELSGSL